jgi:hypothetical protein
VFRVQGVAGAMKGRGAFLNAEPLNTPITRGVEKMINVDSKLKGISNIFG